MGQLGSIAGRITIEGNAAQNLELALLPRPSSSREAATASARTDEAGFYRLTAVPTGYYWLKVLDSRYVNATQWSYDGAGRDVSVADGETVQNANLDLIVGGVIAGRITDSCGNPVADEYVELSFDNEYARYCDDVLGMYENSHEFITDQNGAYRIYGIPPSRYLISIGVDIAKVKGLTRDSPFGSPVDGMGQVFDDHYYRQTYYPGVIHRFLAHAIDVKSGGEIVGLNFAVRKAFRAYSVGGRVVYSDSGEPVRHSHIMLGHKVRGSWRSSYMASGPSDTDLDGDFTVSGLVPGRYFVSVQFDGETDYYCVPVEFEIRDNDITGLEIMAHRGLTLSGIVHVEDPHDPELAKRLRQLRVCVDSVGGTSPNSAREAPVNSDCSFTVRGLRPGPVQVSVGFNDVSKYFSIIRIEHPGPGVETLILSEMPVIFPDRPSLLIPREGLKNVRILLLYKGGSIRGHILVTGARPKSGTRLGAGISRHTGRETWSRGVHVDPNGGFILEGLGPGEYTVSVGTDAVGFPSRTKTVSVKNNCETRVSFLLDLSTKIGRN